MDEAGIHIDKDRFHLCTKSISKSNDYLSFIYEKNVPFDAILTSDDSLAVGAVKFAYKMVLKYLMSWKLSDITIRYLQIAPNRSYHLLTVRLNSYLPMLLTFLWRF